LELACSNEISLQRQIMLVRNEKILLVADAVIGKTQGRIDYVSRLPLGENICVNKEKESSDPKTTEIKLQGKKPRAWVLPLALSEWASETRHGTLRVNDHNLELRATGQGSCLYAPLWFDLDRGRLDEPLTWRQLTVGEHRELLLRDVAVGYRVQVGKKNWLVYRALASKGNRTLLGHNLATEFLLGKFSKKGNVAPIMIVE
jgi:hypothetical protein